MTRAGFDVLSVTYERGEDLYGASKLELEQRLTALAGLRLEESKEEVDWLADFAKSCEWFELQIMSCFILMRELI